MSNKELNLEDYNKWNIVKQDIHKNGVIRTINEGEMWWCGVGKNIGVEINGKGKKFARPVIVLRKLSKYNFIGIPLTSQQHNGSWYVDFVFHEKHEVAVLSQIRNFSVFRVYRCMGTLSVADFKLIKRRVKELLNI